MYVLKINSTKNEIIVGNKSALEIDEIKLRNLNFLCKDIEKYNSNLFVKIRSTGKLIKARVSLKENYAEVKLNEKELGISPGQACVFYSKNNYGYKVLGGGWIEN